MYDLQELSLTDLLHKETKELLEFLRSGDWNHVDQYELLATRMDYFQAVTQIIDAQLAQLRFVQRRVESVCHQPRIPIHLTHALDYWQCQPRRRVHGKVERDETGLGHSRQRQVANREVRTGHLMAARAQPSRGRRQPKRLMPQVVSRQQ